MGVRVSLDGAVVTGQGAGDIETTTIAGRFALDWGKSRHAAESVDGGMDVVPLRDARLRITARAESRMKRSRAVPPDARGRGWLRVGCRPAPRLPRWLAVPARLEEWNRAGHRLAG